MSRDLVELKADISRGLADVAEGLLGDFDPERIIARGRKLLAGRSSSASLKRPKQTWQFARNPKQWDNKD